MARALIKNPKVLIFDEATSALDKKNQALVLKAISDIKQSLGSVTCIVIAHRLSTIKDSDKIVVMHRGKIVEQGTHETLLEQFPDGTYSHLVKVEMKTERANGTDQAFYEEQAIKEDEIET